MDGISNVHTHEEIDSQWKTPISGYLLFLITKCDEQKILIRFRVKGTASASINNNKKPKKTTAITTLNQNDEFIIIVNFTVNVCVNGKM